LQICQKNCDAKNKPFAAVRLQDYVCYFAKFIAEKIYAITGSTAGG
jgi:hypothetical protein